MLELEIDDPYVTLEDSVQFIAPIESDSSVDDIMAFAVNVAPDCPNQHQFDVTVRTSDYFGVPQEVAVVFKVDYIILADDGGSVELSEFKIYRNYPNPFNPTTTLTYDLPLESDVHLAIYDLLGRQVKTLVRQRQNAGQHSITWDATNRSGEPVSAGIYFYHLRAGDFNATGKMLLLK